MRKENEIDKMGRRSMEYLSYQQKFRIRQSIIMKNSRVLSDLELLEGERFNIKLAEKNKEYEQLYRKYQSLQSDYTQIQEANAELERERKLLTEKLGKIQIHTEGDEADQLQEKMALMSSEMMRLRNLSQTKTHEARELSMRVKQLILQKENLQKEIMEKDKIVLNYKQQLRLVEIQLAEQIDNMQIREDHFLDDVKGDNARLKQEIQQLSNSYRGKIEMYKNTEIKNAILQENNERLIQENRDLQKQYRKITNSQEKYRDNQTKIMNLQAQTNYLQQSNQTSKLEVQHLQNNIQQLMREKGFIAQDNQKTKQLNFKLERNLSVLEAELKKVKSQLDDKQTELRQVNYHFSQKIINKSNQIAILQEKTQILQQEVQRGSKNQSQVANYEQILREAQQLERSSVTLKQQLNQYEQKIALLAQQNERLNQRLKDEKQSKSLFDRLKSELQQKNQREKELTKEINSITKKEKDNRQDVQSLREKMRIFEIKQRENENWQFKNRQLKDQLDGLRTLLSVKQTELLNLQRRFQTSPSKNSIYIRNDDFNGKSNVILSHEERENKNRLESQIKLLLDQQARDKAYIKQLDQKQKVNDENYNILSGEIERLNKVLENKAQENRHLKKEVDLLQHKVRTCQGLLEQRKIAQDSFGKIRTQNQSHSKIELYEGKIRKYENELQLIGQRCQSLKEENLKQEARITILTNEKVHEQQKVRDLQYQIGDRAEHFRRVEESFRMTILQIKSSNQRLEKSIKQIETHYISKYQQKEYECDQLRKQRQKLEAISYDLQKSLLTSKQNHNQKLREKQQYINNLNSNHSQIKEETQLYKRLKKEYEAKLALLSQQVQRLNDMKEHQTNQLERLRQYNHESEERFTQSMKQSTANTHAIETLSLQIERLNTVLGENAQKLRVSNKKISTLEFEKVQIDREKDQEIIDRKQLQSEFEQYQEVKSNEISKLRDQLNENVQKCKQLEQQIKIMKENGQHQINLQVERAHQETRKMTETNISLEDKLKRVSREYQNLVVQWQQLRRTQNNSEQDQKMRILSNYQSTIKHMKEENTAIQEQRTKLQIECSQLNKISHELQQKLRKAEEHLKSLSQIPTIAQRQKKQLEEKLIIAMSELNRLDTNSESRKAEIDNLTKNNLLLKKQGNRIDGIEQYTVKMANNNSEDLEHRYILLESINKKLSLDIECLRKTNVEYEFKMNKLKEEFTLLNRLVKEYREENDKLKEKNKGQRGNPFGNTYSNFKSPQHNTVLQISHRSNLSPPPVLRGQNFDGIRNKLFEEIDRLNRVNISLQNEVHDLRLLSTDNLSLRKRLQENAAMMVLLFVEIEALRLRIREKQGLGINSPRKSGISN